VRHSWLISAADMKRVRDFVATQSDRQFVKKRLATLRGPRPPLRKDRVWYGMTGCLLSTQQRSGPGSATTRLLAQRPFPLAYLTIRQQRNAQAFTRKVLKDAGGIRRTDTIASEIARNLELLDGRLWPELMQRLDGLRKQAAASQETATADFIREHLHGFGPKQSRNLLQGLGLSRYEIPIDSRITKWLNSFGFPVPLSATGLGDPGYYAFVSEGIQALCSAAKVLPCILDAAIFASYDKDEWPDNLDLW